MSRLRLEQIASHQSSSQASKGRQDTAGRRKDCGILEKGGAQTQ